MPAPSPQIADFYAAEAAGQPLDTKMQAAVNTLRQAGELPPAGHNWDVEFTDEEGVQWNAQGNPVASPTPAAGETFSYDDPHDAFAAFVREHGPNPDLPALMQQAQAAGVPVEQLDMDHVSTLLQASSAAPAPAAPAQPSSASPAPTTPAPAPLGRTGVPDTDTTDPFMATAASIVGRMGEGWQNLMRAAAPGKGEDPGVLATLQRTPRMLTLENAANLSKAAGPIGLGPVSAASELAGGVLARTLGPYSPVSPETAETIGAFGPLAVGLAKGAARLTSPALRYLAKQEAAHAGKIAEAEEKLRQAGTANVGGILAQAGQLAERGPAGQIVHDVSETIAQRLQREADELFHRSYETAKGKPRELIRPGSVEKVEPGTLPSSPRPREPVPGTAPTAPRYETFPPAGEAGKPTVRVTLGQPGTPPTPGKILTEKDYRAGFLGMRRSHERAAQTAMDYDRHISKRLAKLEGRNAHTAKVLARDPDLLNMVLRQANPIEATLLERAVRSGQRLSDLPLNQSQMEALERATLEPFLPGARPANQQIPSLVRNIIAFALPGRIGQAGLGALLGAATQGASLANPAVLGAVGTYYVSRLGLKALDAALGTARGQAAFRALPGLTPGSPEALGVWATLGQRLAGDAQDDD